MALIEDLTSTQVIFTRYILTTCMILGLIGCFFNVIIFCQKKFRLNSCSVYFIATSIFNVLVILWGITPILLASYLSYDPTSYSSIFCKAKAYVTHIFLMMSRSSVALASIDRYVLCSQNVHIRKLIDRRIAIILVIITSIVWMIIPIHMIVYIDIQMPGERCGGVGIYMIIYSTYAAIATAIPLVIMIIFSYLAVQSLRDIRTRVRPSRININESINISIRILNRDIQLIRILINEVFIYCLSTTWFPIYSIYLTITINTSKTEDRLAIEGFIRYLTLSFFIFLNSCLMFYIHLLASKVFRQECKLFILHLFKCKLNKRILQGTSDVSNIGKQLHRVYNHQQINDIPKNDS